MPELNPNAQKWVDALRSGKYKQGVRALTTVNGEDEFDCCLGVACKVALENGVQFSTHVQAKNLGSPEHPEMKMLRFYEHWNFGTLPLTVRDWLGLCQTDGSYEDRNITQDNDNGQTFEQIATTIERKPKDMFMEGR